MGQFTLAIKTDNAAFHEDDEQALGAEIARILRVAAATLDDVVAGDEGRLYDVNGNHVGEWRIE